MEVGEAEQEPSVERNVPPAGAGQGRARHLRAVRHEQREEGAQGRAHEPPEDGLREGTAAGAGDRTEARAERRVPDVVEQSGAGAQGSDAYAGGGESACGYASGCAARGAACSAAYAAACCRSGTATSATATGIFGL